MFYTIEQNKKSKMICDDSYELNHEQFISAKWLMLIYLDLNS